MFKRTSYNPAKEETNVSKRTIDNLCGRLRVATAVFLTLLLGGFYPGAVSSANAQTAKKETASSRGGGQKEGIKVHGHWTIDVRNPNGTLVTHYEFENGLVPANGLASFLGRAKAAGKWAIMLSSNYDVMSGRGEPHPCKLPPGIPIFPGGTNSALCTISESPTIANNLGLFNSLRVSVPASNEPNAGALVLTGTATAGFDTHIYHVETYLEACEPDVTPSSCGATRVDFINRGFNMTRATLAQPVHVVPDQIIQVTVIISFS